MDFSGVYAVQFTGRVGDGVVTATGVKAGDIILKVWGTSGGENGSNLSSGYNVVVENDDELYQRGLTDTTTYAPTALLIRGVSL